MKKIIRVIFFCISGAIIVFMLPVLLLLVLAAPYICIVTWNNKNPIDFAHVNFTDWIFDLPYKISKIDK